MTAKDAAEVAKERQKPEKPYTEQVGREDLLIEKDTGTGEYNIRERKPHSTPASELTKNQLDKRMQTARKIANIAPPAAITAMA